MNVWKAIVLVQLGLKVFKLGKKLVKAHHINSKKTSSKLIDKYADL